MKHVTASIYISFAFLFYYLQGFETFFKSEYMNVTIFIFGLTGLGYIVSIIRDKTKTNKEQI
jgi:hypothetical protein